MYPWLRQQFFPREWRIPPPAQPCGEVDLESILRLWSEGLARLHAEPQASADPRPAPPAGVAPSAPALPRDLLKRVVNTMWRIEAQFANAEDVGAVRAMRLRFRTLKDTFARSGVILRDFTGDDWAQHQDRTWDAIVPEGGGFDDPEIEAMVEPYIEIDGEVIQFGTPKLREKQETPS